MNISWLEEYKHLYSKIYLNKNIKYKFLGILDGTDDYYYCMYNLDTKFCHFLSCVGDIEDFGFYLEDKEC